MHRESGWTMPPGARCGAQGLDDSDTSVGRLDPKPFTAGVRQP